MSAPVTTGAPIMCPFGIGGSTLIANNKIWLEGKPALTIKDGAFGANILPFALCNAPANPAVIAATAAALGVPTPSVCLGNFVTPWIVPGDSKLKINGVPLLTMGSTIQCAWGGTVKIIDPGQKKVI